ncbi:MAG TPA: hypothetical protein VNT02_03340 [Burkholderiales bacterium]|nr:hypothetical protein [Burkholderiales bacterium]
MKARHAMRAERPVRFDPQQIESETDFVVDWEESDPEIEDIDARETAQLAFGDRVEED